MREVRTISNERGPESRTALDSPSNQSSIFHSDHAAASYQPRIAYSASRRARVAALDRARRAWHVALPAFASSEASDRRFADERNTTLGHQREVRSG